MRLWQPRIALVVILALTAFSVYAAWPSEPDRYLPDFIPWPEGRGISITVPTIEGSTITTTKLERRAMKLGLDLRGGTRMVLEADIPPGSDIDVDEALDGAKDIIERRINAFGVAESEITRQGSDRIAVQLPGVEPDEAFDKIGRTALLRFCEPLHDDEGNIAVVQGGEVLYKSLTCDPQRDGSGDILTEEGASIEFVPRTDITGGQPLYSAEDIVWTPAEAELSGAQTELTGNYLKSNTFVQADPYTGLPLLTFEFNSDGATLFEQITRRLAPPEGEEENEAGQPLAFFLDDEPIRHEDGRIAAPNVRSVIGAQGVIEGLSLEEAHKLSKLLNAGAFPVPLRVVQQQQVDATLGEEAVKASVIAGEVALLLIMLFMVVYYRLPGLLACLALGVYTSLLLAIFKIGPIIGPVTITLAGVAAFVLSIGMAVDANILIFERMKEELRLGRGLVAAIDTGFARAWPSIRDSNISTFITCLILFWFGDQFGEALVKGFALTLAIGVAVSMFSAIFVTRTFLRLMLGTPLARNLSWFASDLPERVVGREPAPLSGGSAEDS
jgi:preprotein translocase subunit SecD